MYIVAGMQLIISFILNLYCLIINCLYRISSRISKGAKNLLFVISVACLSFLGIYRYCFGILPSFLHFDDSVYQITGVFLFALLLLSSIQKPLDPTGFTPNRLFFTGWLFCFFSIFISSFIHPLNCALFTCSLLCLTLIPMIIMVWIDRSGYYHLTIVVCRITVMASFVFLILNLLIVPFLSRTNAFISDDFWGLCNNSNNNGMICTSFYTAALYLLFVDKRNRFASLLSLSLSIVFSVISVCRTAQLAFIFETVIALILFLKHKNEIPKGWSIRGFVIACIASVALSVIAGRILISIDKMDLNSYAKTDYEDASEWVNSNDTLNKINNYSSGRLLIWKAYSSKLNLLGNGSPDGPLMPEFDASRWAHNNALDIWYASGFFAFIGYIVWLIAAIVFVMKTIICRSSFKPDYLLSVTAFSAYFIQAMLEITIFPTTTGIVFLCFITLGPIAFIHYSGKASISYFDKD